MPSSQYYLEVGNKLIASMNEKTSTATALMMGETEVLLKDRSILLNNIHKCDKKAHCTKQPILI
jgi:hypothetical protein